MAWYGHYIVGYTKSTSYSDIDQTTQETKFKYRRQKLMPWKRESSCGQK